MVSLLLGSIEQVTACLWASLSYMSKDGVGGGWSVILFQSVKTLILFILGQKGRVRGAEGRLGCSDVPLPPKFTV